ncbi:response regulator transcription factor [Bacteriovoracaceae bacterium]|nr:response regulator transcription factor [Bacteriovoracaceae bacterium]|tara:strand:+ start:141317 stop:142015 length:699 start_codon:yes stop_codon:yes gene_type:complete
MSASKILVVEDEDHLAEGIKLNLKLKGYDVQRAANGQQGLEIWKQWKPDLIVLDIMMPIMDGYQVLEQIRKEDAKQPILILSAKNEAADKVKALQKGVDDYLDKPFDLEEFLLRVERLLIRGEWSQSKADQIDDLFSFGSFTIDFVQCHFVSRGKKIPLTVQELKVLRLFIAHQGKPVTREQLLKEGWGYDEGTHTRTLDNFMVRLRKYFESDPKNPEYFKSVRGLGYRFDP